jgi:hypothetical protein
LEILHGVISSKLTGVSEMITASFIRAIALALCILVEVDRRFALMTKAVSTSEASVYFDETNNCNISGCCHLQKISQLTN